MVVLTNPSSYEDSFSSSEEYHGQERAQRNKNRKMRSEANAHAQRSANIYNEIDEAGEEEFEFGDEHYGVDDIRIADLEDANAEEEDDSGQAEFERFRTAGANQAGQRMYGGIEPSRSRSRSRTPSLPHSVVRSSNRRRSSSSTSSRPRTASLPNRLNDPPTFKITLNTFSDENCSQIEPDERALVTADTGARPKRSTKVEPLSPDLSDEGRGHGRDLLRPISLDMSECSGDDSRRTSEVSLHQQQMRVRLSIPFDSAHRLSVPNGDDAVQEGIWADPATRASMMRRRTAVGGLSPNTGMSIGAVM